jgi:hypothetical protein
MRPACSMVPWRALSRLRRAVSCRDSQARRRRDPSITSAHRHARLSRVSHLLPGGAEDPNLVRPAGRGKALRFRRFHPSFVVQLLPRGSRFQCPEPPPGQAILNEIRKKWSLRDDFPMSAIYARGSSGGGPDHSGFSENRVAPSIDARLARGLRAVDRDDDS